MKSGAKYIGYFVVFLLIVAAGYIAVSRFREPNEQVSAAAKNFVGFYLLHGRARAEFCQAQQVDIKPFTDAFAEAHRAQLARVREILTPAGVDGNQIYYKFRDQMLGAVRAEMHVKAAAQAQTVTQICQAFAIEANVLANQMHFAKEMPDANRVLMAQGK